MQRVLSTLVLALPKPSAVMRKIASTESWIIAASLRTQESKSERDYMAQIIVHAEAFGSGMMCLVDEFMAGWQAGRT